MASNDFLVFAGGGAANVVSQAVYAASSWIINGFSSGTAASNQLNKVWRQSSIISTVIAQYIADISGANSVDDGTTATLLANFKLALITQFRLKLTAPTTFYVATTGSDSTGTGTSLLPWLTIQHALNYLQTSIDLNGFQATISVANGTYTLGGAITTMPPGATAGVPIQIIGNVTTPTSCIINVTSGNCFYFANAVSALVDGFSLAATGSAPTGNAIVATAAAQVQVGTHIIFGLCSTAHLWCTESASLFLTGGYTISNTASYHVLASLAGYVQMTGATITLSGTPAFSSAFFNVQTAATLQGTGVTYAGTGATGTKYLVSYNGILLTGGALSSIPGTVTTAPTAGGQAA